ncbi:MAG: DAK2 domain-containing protein, partial [Clostridia bacterium]|nr:DAK2 domain-containing protein [Clostridia bacterium]
SVVFGARGNSGVIISQFLKGVSETFFGVKEADAGLLVKALERGVECSYESVAVPVEGTMLTVVKDSAKAVSDCKNGVHSIDDVIEKYLTAAKISLDNTPKLLPTLKEAGVVDSGGAGVVCFFTGIKKYLDGEELEVVDTEEPVQNVDFSSFNMDSRFEYGYCTELLIQLLNGRKAFDYDSFKEQLSLLGESVVVSFDSDKVRIHVHTQTPEEVFAFCHEYGEFLSLKVENMSVQHAETIKNIIRSDTPNDGKFSVVAVAYDRSIQELFLNMGADVVICCDKSASTKDYIEAFENVKTEEILVFPNSSDSTLSALQAKNLYKKAQVTVINSRFVAECYASLPIIDFSETDTGKVIDTIAQTISNLYTVSVAHRSNSIQYNGRTIHKEEFYAFSGKEIIAISKTLADTVSETVKKAVGMNKNDIITVFHEKSISSSQIDSIVEAIDELGVSAEIFTVPSENLPCDLTISFE